MLYKIFEKESNKIKAKIFFKNILCSEYFADNIIICINKHLMSTNNVGCPFCGAYVFGIALGFPVDNGDIGNEKLNVAYLLADRFGEHENVMIHEIYLDEINLQQLLEKYQDRVHTPFRDKPFSWNESTIRFLIWAWQSEIDHFLEKLDAKTAELIKNGVINLVPFELLKRFEQHFENVDRVYDTECITKRLNEDKTSLDTYF